MITIEMIDAAARMRVAATPRYARDMPSRVDALYAPTLIFFAAAAAAAG